MDPFFEVYNQYKKEIERLLNMYEFKHEEKKLNIITTIRNIVLDLEMKLKDFKILIDFLISNDRSFLEKGGDLWNDIKQELINKNNKKIINIEQFIKFFKLIMNETPKGLNTTPNACCGKYELLYFLLNKKSKRPKKGDIMIDGLIYEIKGTNDIRVTNKFLSGKDYKQKMIELHKKYDIDLKGRSEKGGIELLCEPEKPKFKEKYIGYFEKHIEKSKAFHLEWFKIMGSELSNDENEKIHENHKWNYELVIKYIVIKLQEIMKKNEQYDFLVLCFDGTDIKIIKQNECFKQQILDNEIGIGSDFFRTNQSHPIGWYIIPKKDIKLKKEKSKKEKKIKKKGKTVKQLKAECKKRGIKGYSKLKKEELLVLLK
jgi:hypothetical protein